MNMNIDRMVKSTQRMYRKNKKLMLTLLGGAMAGAVAVMISKL